jgi:integrase
MAQIIQIGKMWYSDMRIGEKRIRRALSEYKPQAQKMLKEMVEVRRAEKRGDIVRDMTWANFRDTYLRESKIEKEPPTYYHDKHGFEMVESVAQIVQIGQMTPERLARIRITLKESKKYAFTSITRGIKAIITAMRWAEDRKYVAMQNWRIVQKKNKEPKGRIDFYERDAYLKLLSGLSGDWFTSALLMGRAGLRRGEALHLEWQDIQFEHRRIVFRSKPHYGWKIKKDSDLKKIRMIPILTNDLLQHLEAIRKPSGFVLSDKVSRRGDVYGKNLSKALKATGIKTHAHKLGFPHILRHTFGSHLAQVGVPLKKIQEWMGHEDIKMTNDYAHLCPPDAVSELDISKRLCSGFVPVQNSIPSVGVLLSTLDPEIERVHLSSETSVNS